MAKIQHIVRTAKEANKVKSSKVSKKTENFYIDENGVKVTRCKPGPEPKKLTARC